MFPTSKEGRKQQTQQKSRVLMQTGNIKTEIVPFLSSSPGLSYKVSPKRAEKQHLRQCQQEAPRVADPSPGCFHPPIQFLDGFLHLHCPFVLVPGWEEAQLCPVLCESPGRTIPAATELGAELSQAPASCCCAQAKCLCCCHLFASTRSSQ